MRSKYDIFLKNEFTSRTRVLCICLLLLTFTTAFAADDADHSVFRNRLYKLKHISAEDAGSFLVDMNIGDQIKIMPGNSMMVSAEDPMDLIKTSSILELIDSRDPYTIVTLTDSPDFETMPSIENIESKLTYLSIGTFRNSPSDKSKKLAIIDMHGTNLVAIAPPEHIQSIKEALGLLTDAEKAAQLTTEQATEQKATTTKPKTKLIYLSETSAKDEASAKEKSKSQKVNLKRDTEISQKTKALLKSLEPTDIPHGEEELELTLTLPEKVEIVSLLELVGKQLGLNYIYDAKEIKGEVMLKVHDGKIKVKDTYALLESVLKFRGFVMTRRGNLVTIVPTAKALEYDPTLRRSGDEIQPGDGIVTTIFELENISTQTAQNLLAGMKLGVVFNPIAETRTLIVTGYAYRMERIEQVLNMVDVPGKQLNIRYRQLRYIVAADLAPKVQTLAEKLGTISITVAAPTQTMASPKPSSRSRTRTTTKTATPSNTAQETGETGVYLEADERTNRILMIGKKSDLDIVDGLIDILDIVKRDLRTIKEYEIQYVDPIEILDTLSEVGVISTSSSSSRSSRSTSSRTSSRTARPTAAAKTSETSTSNDADPLTDEPQISILEATNSLLVNATAQQHETIEKIVAHVDRQLDRASTPYVVYPLENQDPEELEEILTKLIDKTKKESKTSKDPKAQTKSVASSVPGISNDDIYVIADPATYSVIVYADKKNQQWIGDIIKELDKYRPQVLLDATLVEITKNDIFKYDLDIVSKLPNFVAGKGLVAEDLIGLLVSPHPTNKTITELRSQSGRGKGFYSDSHVQVLLDVMDQKGYGRVLARPKLLVNDNEEGIIKSEATEYVVREKTSIVPTSGDNSQTVTDVEFESYNAGIELTIQPHISKGDQLRLTINLKRTDFGPEREPVVTSTGEVTPPRNTITSDVDTVVTVPDGSTIILGGIETINQNKSGTKIPILGDIPILGGLFKSTQNTDDQSKLYIFVKAYILRPGEDVTKESDIAKISRKNRAAFEKAEQKFQKHEDWPGTDPDPMDPLRILEDDEPLQ